MRRRKVLKSTALVAVSAVATAALGSCNSTETSESTSSDAASDSSTDGGGVLRVGLVPWLGWSEVKIAEEQGFYAEEGIEVESTLFQSVTEVNTAFLSGQVDLVWLVAADLVVLSESQPEMKFIYASDYAGDVDAIVGRNIADASELVGKTLAREEVPYEIVFVNQFLKSAGLSEEEVNVVPLTAADGSVALVADNIDAVATYEPFVSNALNASDENQILFTAAGTNIIVNGLAANESFLESRREDVLAYLRAIERANQFRDESPEEAVEIIANWIEVSPEETEALLSKVTMMNMEDNKSIVFAEDNDLNVINSINDAGPILVDAGAAAEAVPGENLVDGSFVNEL